MPKLQTFFSNRKVFGILLGIIILLRFLFPEADAPLLKLTPDLSDEGWWAASALSKLKTGTWLLNGKSAGFVLAPLYNAILYIWLSLFGVGGLQLRLMHILVGCGSIAAFHSFVKQTWPPKAEIATLLFAANFFLFTFGRLGFPENIQIALLLWHFALLPKVFSISQNSLVHTFWTGFILGLAFLIKVSFLAIIPAIAVVWLMLSFRNGFNFQKLGLLCSGIFIPIGLWIVAIYLPLRSSFQLQADWMNLVFANPNQAISIARLYNWLMHFIQVPFLLHPSNFLLVILAALSLIQTGNLFSLSVWKEMPLGLAIALSFFWACFVLMLFSDGSERRLVFLLPMLSVIAAGSAFSSETRQPYPVAFLLLVLFFLLGNIFHFIMNHSPFYWKISGALLMLLPFFIYSKTELSFKFLLNRTMLAAFYVWIGCYTLSVSLWLGFEWYVGFAAVPILVLAIAWINKHPHHSQYLLATLIGLNLFLMINFLSQPNFSNKIVSTKAAKVLGTSKVAGPNIIFGFMPYGNHIPLYHSDIAPGYEKFYQPNLAIANFYVDAYPVSKQNYDPLPLLSEIYQMGRTTQEVFRDTVYKRFGGKAEVVVIYDLGK